VGLLVKVAEMENLEITRRANKITTYSTLRGGALPHRLSKRYDISAAILEHDDGENS
jgi:hypothetical protein